MAEQHTNKKNDQEKTMWPLVIGRELAEDERAVVVRNPRHEAIQFNIPGLALLFNIPASSMKPVNLPFGGPYRHNSRMELDGVDNDRHYTGLHSLSLKKAFAGPPVSMVVVVNDQTFQAMKATRPDLISHHTRDLV